MRKRYPADREVPDRPGFLIRRIYNCKLIAGTIKSPANWFFVIPMGFFDIILLAHCTYH
jgi:hypothetical protein